MPNLGEATWCPASRSVDPEKARSVLNIEVDGSSAVAGGVLNGTVTNSEGRPVQARLALERREGDRHVTFPQTAVRGEPVVSDPETGRFSLPVPADAVPTWVGGLAKLSWMVSATEEDGLSDPLTITNPGGPTPTEALLATAGKDPPRLKNLIGEHALSIGMGLAFCAMFVGLGIAALVGASEESSGGLVAFAVGAFVVSLIPLVVSFLALRTIKPRRPRGIDLTIDPLVVAPGERIGIRNDGRPVSDLRLVQVETAWTSFGLTSIGSKNEYRRGRGRTAQPGQFATKQRTMASISFDANGLAETSLPAQAIPTFSGQMVQSRWVLRTGGEKIGRWGPIRLREWHVIVVGARDCDG